MNEENNSNSSSDINNTENNETSENTVVEENTTTTIIYDNSVVENLQTIHNDLGALTSFIIFFVIVLICHYVYKFFNMFFVI